MQDARFNLVGDVQRIPEGEIAAAKELFRKSHPKSFWIDFGDFIGYKFVSIKGGRLTGGFGRVGDVTEQQFNEVQADPVSQFSKPICTHMNDDHMDASIKIVQKQTGVTVEKAELVRVDKLGMDIVVTFKTGDKSRGRIQFQSPAMGRKEVKDRIVELLQAE